MYKTEKITSVDKSTGMTAFGCPSVRESGTGEQPGSRGATTNPAPNPTRGRPVIQSSMAAKPDDLHSRTAE
jgi:hypothetical protein